MKNCVFAVLTRTWMSWLKIGVVARCHNKSELELGPARHVGRAPTRSINHGKFSYE